MPESSVATIDAEISIALARARFGATVIRAEPLDWAAQHLCYLIAA